MKKLTLTAAQTALLKQQYPLGSDFKAQKIVAKVFNPYGSPRTWYLINMDPADSDYLWAIVEGDFGYEVGSVLLSELQGARLTPFKLPLERDLHFKPINAQVAWEKLQKGERL